jgi:hypothetical protein
MVIRRNEFKVVVLKPDTSNTLSTTRKCSYEPGKVLLVPLKLAMPSLHRELIRLCNVSGLHHSFHEIWIHSC